MDDGLKRLLGRLLKRSGWTRFEFFVYGCCVTTAGCIAAVALQSPDLIWSRELFVFMVPIALLIYVAIWLWVRTIPIESHN